jgi:multidrug efflux pump subunit AcrB
MGLELSVTAILGIVSLMGIVVRNGIIMIDYAEELRKEGMNVYDAALNSAKRRMRPIFLTSAAASMGVIPMILGGSVLWSPMGSVIFFGTIISMLLIITVLPISYWIIFVRADKIKERKLIKGKKKLQTQQIA